MVPRDSIRHDVDGNAVMKNSEHPPALNVRTRLKHAARDYKNSRWRGRQRPPKCPSSPKQRRLYRRHLILQCKGCTAHFTIHACYNTVAIQSVLLISDGGVLIFFRPFDVPCLSPVVVHASDSTANYSDQ